MLWAPGLQPLPGARHIRFSFAEQKSSNLTGGLGMKFALFGIRHRAAGA